MQSRREFLRLAGLATGMSLTGLLQACGGAVAPASSTGPAGSAAAAKPASASGAGSASAKPAASGSAAAKPAASASGAAKPAASGGAAASAAGGAQLKVAFGAPVATMALLWVAEASQGFAKRGVNVKLTGVSTAAAIPALIAKDIDVLQLSAAPVITADVNGQADLVFFASGLNHPTFAFYTLPGDQHRGAAQGQGCRLRQTRDAGRLCRGRGAEQDRLEEDGRAAAATWLGRRLPGAG